MEYISPSKFLNELSVIDVCLESGKMYRSTRGSTTATANMQTALNRWLRELNKQRVDLEEAQRIIASFALSNDGNRIKYKLLHSDVDYVNSFYKKTLAYLTNLRYNFISDLQDYKNNKRNAWNLKEGKNSTFFNSYVFKEFNPLFYIIFNQIFDVCEIWEDGLFLDDVKKFLTNGYVIAQSKFKEYKLVETDYFYDEVERVIYG